MYCQGSLLLNRGLLNRSQCHAETAIAVEAAGVAVVPVRRPTTVRSITPAASAYHMVQIMIHTWPHWIYYWFEQIGNH